MSWNDWSYIKKGMIIGAVSGLALFTIAIIDLLSAGGEPSLGVFIFSLTAFPIFKIEKYFGGASTYFLYIIYYLLVGAIIGALIGYIYGKIKSKNQQPSKNKISN